MSWRKIVKVYQVGGSVRDMVLERPPHDLDYVVVGATVKEMEDLGFKQVGKDFPVFFFFFTKDEYALARKEIKTGDKHTDFEFVFDPSISLEDDLQRRDFTCNALAYDVDKNQMVDLVGGVKDIQNKIIRHVNSEHFIEDPLRVLRMCRFAAQLDFEIAPETMRLATKMVKAGMLNHLTAERIWKETEKALASENFYKYIKTARDCGALSIILPEVDKLWSIPERVDYHPEGNSGAHTMLVLQKYKGNNPIINFALLLHDIGKTETPQDILPAHHNHEKRGDLLINQICCRLKVPNEFKNFALLACKNHMKFHQVKNMKVAKVFDFVNEVSNKYKDRQLLENMIEICRCDTFGRDFNISQDEMKDFDLCCSRCRKVFDKISKIKAQDMPNFNELPKDKRFKDLYRQYRLKELQNL